MNNVFGSDKHQVWIDEVQEIVCNFVQNDDDLGELMLDHSEQYWDECFDEGLTPQQALDGFVKILQTSDALEQYKSSKTQNENDGWWVWKIRNIFVKLSKIADDDETTRENYEHELQLLIDEILMRYRATTTGSNA